MTISNFSEFGNYFKKCQASLRISFIVSQNLYSIVVIYWTWVSPRHSCICLFGAFIILWSNIWLFTHFSTRNLWFQFMIIFLSIVSPKSIHDLAGQKRSLVLAIEWGSEHIPGSCYFVALDELLHPSLQLLVWVCIGTSYSW
jgi:hypothetical protein